MLTFSNWFSSVVFPWNIARWSSNFHYPPSFKWERNNNVACSWCLYRLQPGTQQHDFIPAFELPTLSVTSEKNGCHVNVVCWVHSFLYWEYESICKLILNLYTNVNVCVCCLHAPRGTTISARRMVGSMYCSNAGLTNLLYCLMTPSMSLPLSVISLLSRRTSRMSESVSTKIFMSSSWQENMK